ncbi:MAG TPA: hypothetical protein VFC38_11880 [Stellaceae bacterium]|nr:hypothetical protein [Stellaceae bacterium]
MPNEFDPAASSGEGAQNAPPSPPKVHAPRVPTLCRLACQAFEWYLSDREDSPRMPGLVPRAIIAPWWEGLTRLCGGEMDRFERRLKTIIGTGEYGEADQLALDLQKQTTQWTARLLEELGRPDGNAALKELFADRLRIDDVREIARILPMGDKLRSQIAVAFSLLAEEGQMDGRRIHDLSNDTIAILKQLYASWAEAFGPEACYVALALVNRMARPWQILLVGRSLGWRPAESGTPFPEFDIVARRLLLELERAATEIGELVRKDDIVAFMPVIKPMTARYIDDADGINTSFGPFAARADAPWNVAVRETHRRLSTAFDSACLDRVAAIVLAANEDSYGGPSAEAAIAGAQFLSLLIDHGARYGFTAAARGCADRLAKEIEALSQQLIGELQHAPGEALHAKIHAMLRVTEILFKDGDGAQLARNIRMARQVNAA